MSPEALILQPKVIEVRTWTWTSCGGSPTPAVPAALPLAGARVAAGAESPTRSAHCSFDCADIAVYERTQVERVCVCGLHAWAPTSVGLRAAPERGRSRGGCLPLSPGDARSPALCLPPSLHTFNARHVARGAAVRSWIIPLSVWSGLCTLPFFTHVTSSGSANLCVQLSLRYPTLSLAFSCWCTFGWAPGSALGPVLPGAFAHGSAGAPGRAPRRRLWRSKVMTWRTGVRTNSAA